MSETIGLLGAGLLGSAIAARLHEAGWRIRVYDPDPLAHERLHALHEVEWAASEADAFSDLSIAVICLPDSGVTLGLAPGVFPRLAEGALILDCTTGDPDEMTHLGELAAASGCRYLDTTIAGSSQQTRAGEVLILAGGDPADLEAARAPLQAISPRIVHAGPCGYGARMKLVTNLVLGLNRAVLAEALHFASALGLEPETMLAVLQQGPAYSRIMDRKGPRMVRGDYSPEARLSQHRKDVGLMLDAARRLGIRLPLSSAHDMILAAAEEAGFGEQDNSAVIEAFRLRS